MTTHSFTLIVEGVDINDPDVFDALYEAGCDDATIGVTNGIPVMDFDREAASFNEAILSAIADAESVESLRVVRIADPDLVSMSRNRRPDRALARVCPVVGARKTRTGRISATPQRPSRQVSVLALVRCGRLAEGSPWR